MQRLFLKTFSWYSVYINKIVSFTLYAFLAVLFIERFLIIFSYEPHTAGIDNNFDYPIIRSLAGFNMYPDPSAYPYAVNPYAPLFFFICKWIAAFVHIGASDTIAVYRVSRSVSLLADTGTCLLMYFALWGGPLKISRPVSIACTTLFFAIISYLGYTINRSDSLFLFFYCSTICFLFKQPFKKTIWNTAAAALLTTLCIFSKQNGISLLLLVPAWFFIEKKYRNLYQFTFFVSVFCGGLFLYFEYFYTNHFFSEHVINALKNKIDIRWFYVYVLKLMADNLIFVPLAVALVISVKSIAENNNSLLKKIGVLYIFQFIFSTALCLKWGSSRGYYNENFLLGTILIAAYFSQNATNRTTSSARQIMIYTYPALVFFMFHISAQLFFYFINSKKEGREKFNEQLQISNYIKKEIGQTNRYSMDLSNPDFNFFKNMLYKQSAAPNMDAVSCCTLPDNIFNYTGLKNGLQTGKIAFLIERKMDSAHSQWGIDLKHYKTDTSFANYTIYRYDSSGLK